MRNHKFLASLEGIDLGAAEVKDAEQRFLEVKQRVEARKAGVSTEQYELDMFGFEGESEEWD